MFEIPFPFVSLTVPSTLKVSPLYIDVVTYVITVSDNCFEVIGGSSPVSSLNGSYPSGLSNVQLPPPPRSSLFHPSVGMYISTNA